MDTGMVGVSDGTHEALWVRQLRSEVRARLRDQDATQAGLAERLGITEKHMSQMLRGLVTGSPELLERMAGAVGLRIMVMEGGALVPPSLPKRRPHRKRTDAAIRWLAEAGYDVVAGSRKADGAEGFYCALEHLDLAEPEEFYGETIPDAIRRAHAWAVAKAQSRALQGEEAVTALWSCRRTGR
jgi:transcriptional regulator with XRE-family HTH domain